MLFIFKKVLGGLLLPLPLILTLMMIALILLWLTRWQIIGKLLITVSGLLLLLLSLQPVADRLLAPLEDDYPTLTTQARVRFIVVLGGGYTYNADWAPSSNLTNNSLPRVTEGIRQWRQHPEASLIFTGAAAANNPRTSARVAAEVAESLGVPATRILQVGNVKDTRQEAMAVKQIVGQDTMILVTSANHLPRAMAYFKQAGLHPLPAPANQLAIKLPLNFWERALPSALWLGHSERAWYETLGRAWQSLTQPAEHKEARQLTVTD